MFSNGERVIEGAENGEPITIRQMWNGELSDTIKGRFEKLKEHLTPPSLNEDGEEVK